MPNPANMFTGPAVTPAGMAATVETAPATPADLIDVKWTAPPDYGADEQDATERDVRWWCQPGKFPAAGDYALLMTDSVGDAVAFVWATGETP